MVRGDRCLVSAQRERGSKAGTEGRWGLMPPFSMGTMEGVCLTGGLVSIGAHSIKVTMMVAMWQEAQFS